MRTFQVPIIVIDLALKIWLIGGRASSRLVINIGSGLDVSFGRALAAGVANGDMLSLRYQDLPVWRPLIVSVANEFFLPERAASPLQNLERPRPDGGGRW